MPVTLRPFEERDYPAVAAVHSAVNPEHPATPEEVRRLDARLDRTRYTDRRCVAEDDAGAVLGVGGIAHMPWFFHPQKFWMTLIVHPEAQGRGIGSALFDRLQGDLAALHATTVLTETRDRPDALRFLERRAFVEFERMTRMTLSVAGADLTAFRAVVDRVARRGIVIRTLAEAARDDPDYLARLYDLESAAPETGTRYTLPPFDEFVRSLDDGYLSDGFFIAVDGDRYIGTSRLKAPRERTPGRLRQSFTGIHRDYRRQGIATALKVRTIAYARQRGYEQIETRSPNPAMIALNERLGFLGAGADVRFEKRLETDDADA